jgi:hypothetical protein
MRPRRRPSAALVVSLLALLLSLSGWGYAATGGNLILGSENGARGTTRLDSDARHGPTLALKNTGGQAAASFSVKSGRAPFSVGSTTKVTRLNADLLDGADSSGFYQAGSKVADSDRLDGVDSTGFYRAGSKVADADRLDALDSSAFQKRIGKSCVAGSAIRAVNADGSVDCDPPPPGLLSGYQVVEGNVATLTGTAQASATSIASCPTGKIALSGGWFESGNAAPRPAYDVISDGQGGRDANLWIVNLAAPNNTPTGGSESFQAIAICAKVG